MTDTVEPNLCNVCNTPLTNDTPRMQMNCLHWCHTRCGFIACTIAEANIEDWVNTEPFKHCPTCQQVAIPQEWYDEANDRINMLEDQAAVQENDPHTPPPNTATAIPTPLENLELSSPQFNQDIKNFVDAQRADNKSAIAFGKLVSKESKEFKTLTKSAVDILKNHQKQYKKKIMETTEYKAYKRNQVKSARLLTLLENRYDIGSRELRRYIRKKFKVGMVGAFGRRWWSSPAYKIKRAFRIRF